MAKTKNSHRQQEMFSLVEQWQQSSQTKVSFCKAHSINLYTFDYWNIKYKKQNSQTDFVEIKPNQNQIQTPTIRLQYPNGVNIELPASTDISLIGLLIKIQ